MRYTFTVLLLIASYTVHAQWQAETLFPTGGMEGVFCEVIDDHVYMNAGPFYDSLYAYDLVTHQWEQVSVLPGGARYVTFAANLNGKLYIFGGDIGIYQPTSSCWEYDPVEKSWTELAELPNGPRMGGFCFERAPYIYVGCGFDGEGLARDVWAYDTRDDSWRYVGLFPGGGTLFAPSFEAHGKAYVTTGLRDNDETNASYAFDFEEESWSQVADFPGHVRQAAFALGKGTIGLVGGGNTRHERSLQDVWAYDAVSDSWTRQEHLEIPISNTSWSAAFVHDNNAYIGLGISVPTFEYTDSIFVAPLQNVVSVEETLDHHVLTFDVSTNSITYTYDTRVQGELTMELYALNGKKLATERFETMQPTSVPVPKGVRGNILVRILDDAGNMLCSQSLLVH